MLDLLDKSERYSSMSSKSSIGRTQVNFRIEETLLQEIKKAAKIQGISYSEFILNTCKKALGYEISMEDASLTNIQSMPARLEYVESILEEYSQRLDNLEKQSSKSKS